MKKKTIALLLILTLCVTLCLYACDDKGEEENSAPQTISVLRAEESETGYATIFIPDNYRFTALCLSDIQIEPYGRYKYVGADNQKSYMFLEKLLLALKPDVVIANGDMVMSMALNNYDYMKKISEIFEKTSTYWMPIYGNHDCEFKYSGNEDPSNGFLQLTKKAMTRELQKFPHCLISDGDAEGDNTNGNYFVNVVEHSTNEIVYTLCAMDTAYDVENATYTKSRTSGQIAWYEKHIKKISAIRYGEGSDKVVKSLLYTHVGIPEFYRAYEEAWNNGNPNEKYHYGVRLDGNYSSVKCDLFSTAKRLGSTTAMFFAHHHDNDFSVDYEGIRLTFGQHSGFSHNYRTEEYDDGSVDMTLIKQYGDKRGGTEAALSKGENGYELTITPRYAAEIFPDYNEWNIDYDKVVEDLRADNVNVIGWD